MDLLFFHRSLQEDRRWTFQSRKCGEEVSQDYREDGHVAAGCLGGAERRTACGLLCRVRDAPAHFRKQLALRFARADLTTDVTGGVQIIFSILGAPARDLEYLTECNIAQLRATATPTQASDANK